MKYGKKDINKDIINYYEIKNNGYTLNDYRRKIEGDSDIDKLIFNFKNSHDNKKILNISKVKENKEFNLLFNRYQEKV